MGMTEEERVALVEMRIAKAYRVYEEAKGVAGLKYWDVVANRLYYAALNAVTALLMANGDTAQTHTGVRHVLGLKFIKAGILSHETGRLYHRLFSMRQTSDYDDTYEVSEEEVLPNVEPTGKLIDDIAAMARRLIAG